LPAVSGVDTTSHCRTDCKEFNQSLDVDDVRTLIRATTARASAPFCLFTGSIMKIKNSLKALMRRDRNNKLVRRRGRVYIINKKAPRFKARQG